uniref:DUF148 domain-containing protein n=1 Tax=Panagrellus redivivus TaxID=6233 RepID=A0A7E4W4M2_PANRE
MLAKFVLGLCIFCLISGSADADDLTLIESCTLKVKEYLGTNQTAQDDYKALLSNGSDVLQYQIHLILQVCPTDEANVTAEFISSNSEVITKLAAFTKTLSEEDVAEFVNLQKTGQFAKMISFVKDQYDNANETEQETLKELMRSLIPMLLKNFNASDAVTNYFNSLTPDALVNIVDIAETHNVTALKQTVIGTFNSLNTTANEREQIGRFIDSIHNLKNIAASRSQQKSSR